jgi:hypothetical protein
LQTARRRSGKLGGRPAKPTVSEARSEALERLLPKAIRVVEEHLESGKPDAWRSAHRVLEHCWGRPPDHVVSAVGSAAAEVDGRRLSEMSTEELVTLAHAKRRELTLHQIEVDER